MYQTCKIQPFMIKAKDMQENLKPDLLLPVNPNLFFVQPLWTFDLGYRSTCKYATSKATKKTGVKLQLIDFFCFFVLFCVF